MSDPNPNPNPNPGDKGAVTVTAADARTFLSDFVSDPENLATRSDEDVLKLHDRVKGALPKYFPKVEPPKVPDKYDFKFSDGLEMDPKAAEAFTPLLKKYGISQEAAQDLASAWVAELSRQDGVINEMYTGQVESWEAAVKADKEIGGANYDASLAVARKGIAKFATPELKGILDQTGLGSHPEMVRLFTKLGKLASEDTHVSTSGASSSDEAVAAKLFNHPTSQSFK